MRNSEREQLQLDSVPGSGEAITAAISWIGLALSLLLLFLRLSLADPAAVDRVWLSSDTLYPANVFTDVFFDGFGISGWHFSIAPCWFPDLATVGLFVGLTRNVVLATLLAGFVQIGALVLLCRAFCMALGLKRPGALDPVLLLVAVVLTCFVANDPGVTAPALFQLFLPQTHVGSLCVVLGALALAIGIVRRQAEDGSSAWPMVSGYLVLCALGAMSNVLFVANALAPLTVVVAAFVPLGLLQRRSGGLLLLGWPAAAAGVFLNRSLFRVTDLGAQSGTSRDRVATALEVFSHGFISKLASGEPLHIAAVIWVMVCLAFVAISLRSARTGRSDEAWRGQAMAGMLFLCLVLSGAAGCAAIVLGGSNGLAVFKDYTWSMHYLHPTFLLPIFGLPAVVAWSLQQVWPAVFQWLQRACAVIACALPLHGLAATRAPPTLVQARVPPLTQFMDGIASREHLKYGFAGYWQARPMTLLSRTGLRVYAVDGSMRPFLWVSNAQWYEQLRRGDGRGFKVDFVILDDPLWKLTRESAVSAFGEPKQELRFENTRVLIYGAQR